MTWKESPAIHFRHKKFKKKQAIMLGRATTTVLRRSLARSAATTTSTAVRSTTAAFAPAATAAHKLPSTRSFSSAIEENLSAKDAWQKSCYVQIDYTISEEATVYDAIQRFAAYDIGCLVTVDAEGAFICLELCRYYLFMRPEEDSNVP